MANTPFIPEEIVRCFDYVLRQKYDLYNDHLSYAEKEEALVAHLFDETLFKCSKLKWEYFQVALNYTHFTLKHKIIQIPPRNYVERNIYDCRELHDIMDKAGSLFQVRMLLDCKLSLTRHTDSFNLVYFIVMLRDQQILKTISTEDFIQMCNINFIERGLLVPRRIVEVTYDQNSDVEKYFTTTKSSYPTSYAYFMIDTEHLDSIICSGLEPYIGRSSESALQLSHEPVDVKVPVVIQDDPCFNFRAMVVCEYIRDFRRIDKFSIQNFRIRTANANLVKVKYILSYYANIPVQFEAPNTDFSDFTFYVWFAPFVVCALFCFLSEYLQMFK